MKNAALFLVAVLGTLGVAHCGGAVSGGNDAGTCVTVDLSSSGQARFEAALSPVLSSIPVGGGCNCGVSRSPLCVSGVCTVCAGGPSDPPACGFYGSADSSDGSEPGSVDGGEPTCVPHNGVYTCLGGSWPACVTTSFGAFSSCPPGATSCMGCYQGSGYISPCGDGGLAGVGTESTCQ